MDFFAQQDLARRNTRKLVLLFALAVAGTVLAIYVAVLAIFHEEAIVDGNPLFGLWNRQLFVWVAGLTGTVVASGSLYKTAALQRGGGGAVAGLLGGKPLPPNTRDAAQRRVLNVVEEMALASGTAVPSVYLLPDEAAINAFAAGLSKDAAVVGVTAGAVDLLERDELQGVVAHEFSHILNGDMRLNVRLMGLVHGILVISLIGYWVLRLTSGSSSSSSSSSSSGKKGGGGGAAIFLFGLALYLIGWIGVFFGEVIKSAVSRQRELLADASAVQFTRNPLGIAGALKKIGGLAAGSRLASPHAPQASHFFFGNGLKESRFAWRSTHPPLVERIRRLDPSWDGSFPRLETRAATAAPAATGAEAVAVVAPAAVAAGAGGFLGRVGAVLAAGTAEAVAPMGALGAEAAAAAPSAAATASPPLAPTPAALAASAGRPTPAHLLGAAALIGALDPALRAAAREPMAARALVLALLCDADAEVRRRQLQGLAAAGDDLLVRELGTLLPLVATLPAASRLPLVDLAVPALRRLSKPQFTTFRAQVDQLVRADQRLSLFEYALHRVLLRHLDPWFTPQPPPRVTTDALGTLPGPVAVLLSALAHAGSDTPAAAAAAFAQGVAALGAQAPAGVALLARADCTFRALDDALAALRGVASRRVQDLITACGATVAQDGVVCEAEAELLRAIADALGAPIPPLLAAA